MKDIAASIGLEPHPVVVSQRLRTTINLKLAAIGCQPLCALLHGRIAGKSLERSQDQAKRGWLKIINIGEFGMSPLLAGLLRTLVFKLLRLDQCGF